MSASDTPSEPRATCDAEAAGYDGLFGVACSLPLGHKGLHNDGWTEWDFVDPELRNSIEPPQTEVPRV